MKKIKKISENSKNKEIAKESLSYLLLYEKIPKYLGSIEFHDTI